MLEVVNEVHQAQFHAFLELCRKEPATHHALHLSKVFFGEGRQQHDFRTSQAVMKHLGVEDVFNGLYLTLLLP